MDPPGDAQPCSVEGRECASLSIIYAHHFSVHVKRKNSTQQCKLMGRGRALPVAIHKDTLQ